MADDLAAVLTAADRRGRAVLVGASLGAPILHLFARAHPGRVAGVVLVDAAVGENLRPAQIRVIKTMFAVYSAESRIGLHTLRRERMGPLTAALPAADQALLMRDLCDRRTVLMGAREARELTQPPSLQRLLTDLPEVPRASDRFRDQAGLLPGNEVPAAGGAQPLPQPAASPPRRPWRAMS